MNDAQFQVRLAYSRLELHRAARQSAERVGGGAALGAVIGALTGGGKGAAIGTLAGAGAGTLAQVSTSGQQVKVPSETRLVFTLSNPLVL